MKVGRSVAERRQTIILGCHTVLAGDGRWICASIGGCGNRMRARCRYSDVYPIWLEVRRQHLLWRSRAPVQETGKSQIINVVTLPKQRRRNAFKNLLQWYSFKRGYNALHYFNTVFCHIVGILWTSEVWNIRILSEYRHDNPIIRERQQTRVSYFQSSFRLQVWNWGSITEFYLKFCCGLFWLLTLHTQWSRTKNNSPRTNGAACIQICLSWQKQNDWDSENSPNQSPPRDIGNVHGLKCCS